MKLPLRSSVLALLVSALSVPHTSAQASGGRLYDYYPPIEPFRTGHLKVSDLHEIYYEISGNPLGKPVIVLHGGPGGGSYPSLRRYHDPQLYQIVLFDQRGAGRSRPAGELRENTTDDLVADIEKLRKELKFDKMQVFGGSWGSTLALTYAQKHPDRVSALVLRGVFLATRREIDHLYHGGVAEYFPEVHEKLKAVIPQPDRLNYPQQLLDLLKGADSDKRDRVARAWAGYETKIAALSVSDREVEAILDNADCLNFSLLKNYYMANGCFLKEGELLRGAAGLSGIPTVIVHGRYDMVSTPRTARELHQAIPGSRLVMVESAGHSGGELLMRSALIEAVQSLDGSRAGDDR